MSVEKTMLSMKDLKTMFRKLKREQAASGVLECAQGTDLFSEFMRRIGDSPVFILQEIASKTIKEVNREDARFDFKDRQTAFSSYGEKWILLPEEKTVQVEYARIEHVRHQADQILQEHIQKLQAFIVHHDGILMPVIRTMETHNFLTAGEALGFLNDKAA